MTFCWVGVSALKRMTLKKAEANMPPPAPSPVIEPSDNEEDDDECCISAFTLPYLSYNAVMHGICYQNVCPSVCPVRPSHSRVTPKPFKISKRLLYMTP